MPIYADRKVGRRREIKGVINWLVQNILSVNIKTKCVCDTHIVHAYLTRKIKVKQ